MNALLYIATIVVWGSTWLGIKFQLGVVAPEASICYRFALATLVLFAWCVYRGKNLRYSWQMHAWFLAQGFFLFSVNYVFAYSAANYIPSGINAIGFSMVLVFNILNSALFYRAPITRPVIIGTLCGLAGVLAIFWPAVSALDLTSTSLLGMSLSLAGGIFASYGNMISSHLQKQCVGVGESNTFAMGYGTLWMLVIIICSDIEFTFDLSPAYVISLLHLAISGSVIAFGCYLTLLGRIGASKAAYTLILVPVMALIVSTLFEDFTWEPHVFLGVGLILFGNVVLLARKPNKTIRTLKEGSKNQNQPAAETS